MVYGHFSEHVPYNYKQTTIRLQVHQKVNNFSFKNKSRDFATSRGVSNSIGKYCNTFEILQYLLQYFEILQYLLQHFRNFAIFIVILSIFCNTFEILQYLLQYF